ncbi:MAG: glycosyltransferase family 2 protein [bacterium]|nr:glycosyltransferase family 2 protein [bacterium]
MKKNKGTDISIVIPAKNEGKNIGRCLQAILDQETDYQLEIIVIDSGSTDDTLSILRTFPSVKLLEIKAEEFGHGKTRNMAARTANGRFIVFLNADAVPMDNYWLNRLVEPLEKSDKIAGVFSRHVPAEDCYLYMARDLQKSMPKEPALRTQYGALDFMLFSTVSAAMPKQTWEKYPFRDDIIIAEDQQWAKDVLSAGLEIFYNPNSAVRHSHNYSSRELQESKRKVALASGRFKSKTAARIVGFFLVAAGFKLKLLGDIIYIFKQPRSFGEKRKEIKIAASARFSSFWGRYRGWLDGAGKNNYR